MIFGLVGVIIGALISGLFSLWIVKRSRKKDEAEERKAAKAQKMGELDAEQERLAKELKTKEERYFDAVRAAHQRIKLLGFLSQANIDVGLLDVFVNLRFSDPIREKEIPTSKTEELSQERLLSPQQVMARAVQEKKILLILGAPGSGKTTLLKYFAICCLDREKYEQVGLTSPLIPILVPLRNVDPHVPFVQSLCKWATSQNFDLNPEIVENWLTRRGALVLLDGVDEVSSLDDRQAVCRWIDTAFPNFQKSLFVVTCRFTGYRETEGVALQSPHVRADVMDLNDEQKRTFLFQWFNATGLERLDAKDRGDISKHDEVEFQAKRDCDALMDTISQPENRSLLEMAGVPVMLQIMATVWKEYGSLPPERVELFDRSTEFLLFYRDKYRDIEPLMTASQAKSILRPLALKMQWEWKSDEVAEKDLLVLIQPLIQRVRSDLQGKAFLENIRDRAGVLVGSGTETYTFQHKSIREFFAAEELGNRREVRPLVENFGKDWWRETTLFASGLSKPCIFPDFMDTLMKSEKNFGETPHLLLRCVYEAIAPDEKPFIDCLQNRELPWQARYNALQCLKIIGSENAQNAVKLALKDPHSRVSELARNILFEWKLIDVEPAMEIDDQLELPKRYLSFLENNAEYILIPPGIFKLGETRKQATIEKPYYLAKFPVTNRLYGIFVETTDHRKPEYWDDKRFKEPNQPVVGVSWDDAVAYCKWLSQNSKDEMEFRLPTEEEWEWAAGRGERKYPWGSEEPDHNRANYEEKVGQPTPVGSYPAGSTPDGLMDMAGNVWEWTDTDYDYKKYKEDVKVLRGGSFRNAASLLRCSYRLGSPRNAGWSGLGFRVVCVSSGHL